MLWTAVPIRTKTRHRPWAAAPSRGGGGEGGGAQSFKFCVSVDVEDPAACHVLTGYLHLLNSFLKIIANAISQEKGELYALKGGPDLVNVDEEFLYLDTRPPPQIRTVVREQKGG